ncbi:phage tail protein [Brevibacillus sp. TJ4]|uniref:phage tail protein n=1 Tax=Brevibacillus sp. TJ4 TaxID=3234853 RepID=UPI0037D52341
MDQYVGEIRMFGGNYAPQGWAFCNGQLLSPDQYPALFALIGTTYGGDGVGTFALPDLRGRLPVHMGTNPGTNTAYSLGQKGGVETVALTQNQLPHHTHVVQASSQAGTSNNPENNVWASGQQLFYNGVQSSGITMGSSISATGGAQPHNNIMPFLATNFIIALDGNWPPQD